MSALKERGADGLTLGEAIARRVFLGIERLVEAHKAGKLDFDSAHEAITVLAETTLPFVDPGSRETIHQVLRWWDEELSRRKEADEALVRSGMIKPANGHGSWA